MQVYDAMESCVAAIGVMRFLCVTPVTHFFIFRTTPEGSWMTGTIQIFFQRRTIMSYSNWGTNNETGAAATQKNVQKYASGVTNPQQIGDYHQTYAKTLEGLGNLIIFGVPLLPAILVGVIVYSILEQVGLLIALGIYVLFVFILWIVVSYCIKLFDNISKMAQNTEIMIALMKDGQNGH